MLRRRGVVLAGSIGVFATIGVLGRKATAPAAGSAQPVAAASKAQPVLTASELRLERIALSTGVELQVAQRGPADGKSVLFLHGFTDSWFSYSLILDALPPDVRAIVPSLRGHGDSERPSCCYLIADFARDAIALLDALGIARADVVGHSMGSFIAQRIAIDHPDRVDRLVLIGSGTTVATPPAVGFNQAVQALTDPIDPSFIRDFQTSTTHEPLPLAFLDRVVTESAKLPARVWRATLAGLLTEDAKDELGRIRANTLIVWGEHDSYWVRSEQDALVRAIPRARLITYEGVAHSPHWEDPHRFVADLRNFLNPAAAPAAP